MARPSSTGSASPQPASTSADGNATGALVDPHGGTVVCEAEGGQAVIYQYKRQGQPKEKVLAFSRAVALQGWQIQGEICGSPLSWAPDFSRHVVAATPPGSKVSHVVDIDVRAGTFTDLTAPRQKSGFSDAVLGESSPMFLSDQPSPKATFGSNMVLLNSNNEWVLVDRRSPETATPFPDSTTWVAGAAPGHPEMFHRGGSKGIPNQYIELSPDGTMLAESSGFRRTTDMSTFIRIECPELLPGWGDVMGWVDNNHLILADHRQASIVTVSGTPKCQPIIPATDKQISSLYLSEDGAKLHFKADNTSGGTTDYSIPVSKPGAEPTPEAYPPTPTHFIYRPGNY